MKEMKWQPVSTAPTDGTVVDLWVEDVHCDAGGQRFTDMYYCPGAVNEPNDWIGDMIALSDCGYTVDDITHWMKVEGPDTE